MRHSSRAFRNVITHPVLPILSLRSANQDKTPEESTKVFGFLAWVSLLLFRFR